MIITKEEALAIGIKVLRERKTKLLGDHVLAFRLDPNKRDDHQSGWVVTAKLNVPEDFESTWISVYIMEPDGEIYIPMML